MSEGPKYPPKIRYEYDVPEDLQTRYAHGVWGGINPHGEIEMNLYTESDKLPDFSERSVNPDGSIGPETVTRSGDYKPVVRNVHTKLVLNYRTARAIIEWLQNKVDTLETESRRFNAAFQGGPEGPEQ